MKIQEHCLNSLRKNNDAPVQILDLMNLKTEDIDNVLENVLYEFPIQGN